MFHPKFVVPNGFTALSMLFGLASLLASAQGSFTLAAWLICWGVLLDKLDGTAARLLGASSSFGAELDSFADFVVFGIAPAALIYHRLSPSFQGDERLLLLLGAGAFVLANAARLARFNTTSPEGGDVLFYGVPTTLCGALIATTYLVWEKYGLDEGLLRGMVGLLFISGLAMVSSLRLPKLKRRKNKLLDGLQMINIAGAYGFAALRMFPEYLWAMVILYLIIGLGWGLRVGEAAKARA
ncbi:CDP-alcohol phosphatidyltransferase family protein [Myxococcota bacterium]|nr:CDP-alcohol phosphatidyltransferase family protein [Myxococcota bacterium]MBU1432063.1 CDP-alcohol phosphatidyltransferase family protein [Myxococcota bacterium]MBU1897936.1 CDP-alcohol phosphatidyltransferase family protein [Myxococcota bacterium]